MEAQRAALSWLTAPSPVSVTEHSARSKRAVIKEEVQDAGRRLAIEKKVESVALRVLHMAMEISFLDPVSRSCMIHHKFHLVRKHTRTDHVSSK